MNAERIPIRSGWGSFINKILRVLTPLMLLATFALLLGRYEALRENREQSNELFGGKFQIADLAFDIPSTQKIFLRPDEIVSAGGAVDDGARRVKSLSLAYRREGAPAQPAPGAAVGVSFLQMDRACMLDFWRRNDPDGMKGGKFLKPEEARERTADFYVYDRNVEGRHTLVAANSRTFFGAPATLEQSDNNLPFGGVGTDYKHHYATMAALSPQVMLIVDFNDLALKDVSIFDLLTAVENDVRRWLAPQSSSPKTLGRGEAALCGE